MERYALFGKLWRRVPGVTLAAPALTTTTVALAAAALALAAAILRAKLYAVSHSAELLSFSSSVHCKWHGPREHPQP